ncbi:MAG: acyltransferase family protein [Paraclostridium sp.]
MKKIKFLDGLRGISALIVVISHYIQVFYPSVYNGNLDSLHTKNNIELFFYKTPLNLFLNANFSVCIFFVLSGYVLSIKFFKYNNRRIIASAILKRYLRLVIPVFSVLTLSYLMYKFNVFHLGDVSLITKTDIMNRYLINYSYIDIIKQSLFQVFLFDIETYNAVLWTMKYEFIGSFIVFFILTSFSYCKYKKTIFISLIIVFFNSYYLGFILGSVIAYITTNKDFEFKNSTLIFLLFLSLFWGSYPYYQGYSLIYYQFKGINNFVFFHTLGGTLLVFVIINFKKIQDILSSKIIIFLGKISFSLYLVHFIFINSIASYIFLKSIQTFNYHISFLISFSISLIFSIIVAHFFYKFIDLFSIYFSNKFSVFFLRRIDSYRKSPLVKNI